MSCEYVSPESVLARHTMKKNRSPHLNRFLLEHRSSYEVVLNLREAHRISLEIISTIFLFHIPWF